MSKEADSSGNSDGNPSQTISLKAAIKKVVNVTNSTLATFEQTTDESSTAFASRLTSLARQAKFIATRGMATYEQRGNYGPQIIGGTALVVGGAVALRRGRFPGALAGGLGGAAAYGNIYGYQDYYPAKSWKDYVTKKND
eukprot:scaffold3348_cov79-Skeletonema_marinoi.AAC.1